MKNSWLVELALVLTVIFKCSVLAVIEGENGRDDANLLDLDADLVTMDRGEPELEACPRVGLDDKQLSACFTRVFKNDLLPYLEEGIPELGIRSIDPIIVPNASFTFLDIGIIRWVAHVKDLEVSGSSRMSKSDIVIDTKAQTIAGHLTFPKIEGKSANATVDGHVFGIPLSWFASEGQIWFSIKDLAAVATFKVRPTKSELIRFMNLEYDIQGFVTREQGIANLPVITRVMNWVMKTFSREFFEYIIRPGFLIIFTDMITTFLDPNTWRIIIGDIQLA